jgi:integrase
MARRGHGEGSIYQRKDGRWVASITLENRKRKYIYGETRKEVQEKLKVALHEQQQGALATGPQQLLKVFLEQWLESVYKPTVKPNSYKQYRVAIRTHLIPALGHIPIQKLTAAKVQAFYTQKLDEGLAPRTVIAIHSVLHRALETAVRWGLVPRNITKLVSLPHAERYEAQTLTVEQAGKLLEAARGSRIEALLLVAVTTGMRRGELLALHWDDVDLEKGVLYIRRTMSKIAGYGYKESEPKTRTGRRKVVLPVVAVEALKEHRLQQDQARLEAGEKWHDRGIVFCNNYGAFFNPDRLLKIFNKLLRDAGLPHMRFHDLRHSAATILLTSGVHPKIVQERLGHSTIAMTLDVYSHVLPSIQQEAADKMDDLFKAHE